MTATAIAALLCAGALRAQVGGVTATTTMSDRAFNAADCDSDQLLEATFTYLTSSFYNPQYALFGVNARTPGEVSLCYNQPSTNNVLLDGESLPLDGIVELPEDHEITVAEFLAPICEGNGYDGRRLLCFRVTEYTSAQGTGIDFIVDTLVPGAPTELRWQGGDRSISLASVVAPSGVMPGQTMTYIIEMRPCSGGSMPTLDAGSDDRAVGSDSTGPEDATLEDAAGEDGAWEDAAAVEDAAAAEDGALVDDAATADSAAADDAGGEDAGLAESICGSSGEFREVKRGVQLPLSVRGLENGRRYEVRVRVQDGAGNVGPPSEAAVVTPQPEFGFWDVYGGAEQGCVSCAGAGPARPPLALLLLGAGLLAARRLRRRARRGGALWLAALTLLLATSARAAPPQVGLRLSAGPYKPDMDSEPGANDVYRCVFEDKTWVLLATGLDYIVFDLIGTLTIGGELGYFTVNGHERTAVPEAGQCGAASSSRNTLHILPLSANLHYRFDWPYHQFGFPLAPYGRVGLNATPWAITRNAQFQSSDPSSGVRTGWQWALGLAFVLDAVDELRMKRVRDAGTFQHAYLFGEYRDMRIDSFGDPGFRLGSRTWMIGINLDI